MPLEPMPYLMQGIPHDFVEHFWAFAEPYIKRALDHTSGEFTAADFKKSCLARNMQLWLISQDKRIYGAVTTELVIYPQRKHCRIITLAGSNFIEWVGLANATLDAWAKANGCTAMEAYTRKGFVPKLTPLGYKHKHSVLVKEL